MALRVRLIGVLLAAWGTGCLEVPDNESSGRLLGENEALSEVPPVLRPISRDLATRLAQRIRTLRIGDAQPPDPVAWAWAQLSCELRSAAVEWSLARGPFATDVDGPDAPPLIPLTSAEVTMENLTALSTARVFDAATIWLSGPLSTKQSFVLPDGRNVTAPPFDTIAWPVHIAAIVNVEGSLEVLDLSTGDAPQPISQWIAQFVAPGIECPAVPLQEFRKIRGYWGARILDLPVRPAAPPRACGWLYSSAFANDARWLREVPTLLPGDTHLLANDLTRATDAPFSDEEVPRVLARFEGVPWASH